MKLGIKLLLIACLTWATSAQAQLRVFSCEPEWTALLQELGGDKLKIHTAIHALQDPHSIEARPSLIAKIRRADLLVCTGAELEVAWLPMLLRRGNNPNIQPGTAGHFMAADYVELNEQPKELDRSMGDVHAAGNPHVHTSAHNILPIAKALNETLQQLDNKSKNFYQQRFTDFEQRWTAALTKWDEQAKQLSGVKIVSQHQGWSYMLLWLGLEEVAVLEPKPGLPPGAAQLAKVVNTLKNNPAKIVISSAYQNNRSSLWLADKSGVKAVTLPYTVGGNDKANDLFSFYDETLRLLVEASK
jgi:zinc/manganese transport system substrate-binding protein